MTVNTVVPVAESRLFIGFMVELAPQARIARGLACGIRIMGAVIARCNIVFGTAAL
jgi:hypothetical protein